MVIICRHCGAKEGFYVKERVSGTATIFYNDKGDYMAEQSTIYDSLIHTGGKIAYCNNCHRSIGKSENLKSGNSEKDSTFC